MWRSIGAAVLGYVVMVAVVLAGIFIAWSMLGGGRAFAGEGPEPSTLWIALNVLFGFVASVVGGWVCLRIGGERRAVNILIGMMLVLGAYAAITAESNWADNEPVNKPVGEMTFAEAGQHAKAPSWYNWIIPVIGVAGVLVGARLQGGGEE